MVTKVLTLMGLLPLVLLATACAGTTTKPSITGQPMATSMDRMGSMAISVSSKDYAPPVPGFYEGGDVLFIHTEASDPDVANMLTEMMGPLVVLTPQLSRVPESLLGNVYAFTNGLDGHGPFGFQADVFDTVPGDEEYSPLRAVNLVSWNEGFEARELRSLTEINAAVARGELTITRPGIVINMPILTWRGGTR